MIFDISWNSGHVDPCYYVFPTYSLDISLIDGIVSYGDLSEHLNMAVHLSIPQISPLINYSVTSTFYLVYMALHHTPSLHIDFHES
jgi:hypothetical protein